MKYLFAIMLLGVCTLPFVVGQLSGPLGGLRQGPQPLPRTQPDFRNVQKPGVSLDVDRVLVDYKQREIIVTAVQHNLNQKVLLWTDNRIYNGYKLYSVRGVQQNGPAVSQQTLPMHKQQGQDGIVISGGNNKDVLIGF